MHLVNQRATFSPIHNASPTTLLSYPVGWPLAGHRAIYTEADYCHFGLQTYLCSGDGMRSLWLITALKEKAMSFLEFEILHPRPMNCI